MRLWIALGLLTAGNVFAAGGEPFKIEMVRQNLEQGGFYVARVPADTSAWFNGKPVAVGDDSLVVVGFAREQPMTNTLKVCRNDMCEEETLEVQPRTYKIQKVVNVPQKTVEPSKAELKMIAADNVAIGATKRAATMDSASRYADFAKPFRLPFVAPTSGVYGSGRSYNGKEFGSWHKGHDLAAPTGTVVHAPADGIVRLVRWTFLTGNLIIMDHGAGVQSLYAHLSKTGVKVGDRVKAGDVLGEVGTTGRSSGPHLHWGMYWQDVVIDPILWVGDKDRLKVQGKK